MPLLLSTLSRWTPDFILDSTRSTRLTMLSLLSRWMPDLIASMLSQGALLQYADFNFYNQLTGVFLDWQVMAGGCSQHHLYHYGQVVMIFCCFCGWLGKKRKRTNQQNFCNSFSVQDLIKVPQSNITTRNNGTMNSQ
jgi:hypothetical protein